MSIVTYESDDIRPCDVTRMKRAKLEDLAIDQMREITRLQDDNRRMSEILFAIKSSVDDITAESP